MGLLDLLGGKKAPSPKQLRDMLPTLHSFVDVAVRNGPKGSVCFENAGIKTFITSVLPGMAAGQQVTFSYSTTTGKIPLHDRGESGRRQTSDIRYPRQDRDGAEVRGSRETHQRPHRYDGTGAMALFVDRQDRERMAKGNIERSQPHGRSSLATERDIKIGNILELKMPLAPSGAPTLARAEAKRVQKIEGTSKFNGRLELSAAGRRGRTRGPRFHQPPPSRPPQPRPRLTASPGDDR